MINSLIKKLKSVKDTREDKGKRHPLWVILMIVILGNMLGFSSYRALGDFTCFYQTQLCSFLQIQNKQMPSYSTIRRVLKSLETQLLINIFNQWVESFFNHEGEENLWCSLDGKTLRNTLTNECDKMQNFVVLISLFCQKTGLVLNLETYESKEASELKTVQKQCQKIVWENLIMSLDALHCQKETTEIITKGGNDYLIAVKKNQPSLYKKIEKIAKEKQADSECIKQDNSHGRKIERKVSVWENKEVRKNSVLNKFSEIKSLIKVERRGTRGKKEYKQIMYYISSKKEKAEVFLEKIKDHWKIENRLHWGGTDSEPVSLY